MMKIALAQLNYHIGNFNANTDKIISHIQKAIADGADLVVFAELALTGYPPLDLLFYEHFVQQAENSLNEIKKHTKGITAIIGAPTRNAAGKGKNLFNSAVIMRDGEIIAETHKTLLPDYDVFDEYRYFEPNTTFHCHEIKGTRVAVTICEDLWNVEALQLYPSSPMEQLIKEQPQLIINIAASPFSRNHIERRKQILLKNNAQYALPMLYINHVGAQTEIIFDGGSLLINKDGSVSDELAYFDEEYAIYDFDGERFHKIGIDQSFLPEDKTERIHDALITGIKDYFRKSGFTKAVLGSSGGIDSAVVQALATKALGAENVIALLMPSRFSSDHSVNDALDLCEHLGNPHHIIPIEQAHEAFGNILEKPLLGVEGLTDENIQSRCRGIILMAYSNKSGSILLNTSNKSELAVGYGTLYGDMAGGLSIIGDLYKTEVYKLAHFINKDQEVIPANILTKVPSAELRPDQKDSDSLPDYEILDKILINYIEQCKSEEAITALGIDEAIVRKSVRLVNVNEYKRKQFMPILRISDKAFGQSRKMPIVAKY